ncbi:unnamed protein product [Peniophora sp. CBMAI 1063]|nr:unnamed protein product [Peniophora sp. CBMAI 1063]
MPFQTRNTYYLRISPNTVLPLFVYLDERHVDWMSDRVLRHVLEDLRLKIPNKLRAEDHINLASGSSASAKRGTVDVHRGDAYQFAFFFKYTEPHSLLIKQRNFTLITETEPLPLPPGIEVQGRRKSKGSGKKRDNSSTATRRPNKRRRQTRADEEETSIDIGEDDDGGGAAVATSGPRRSSRRAGTSRKYREQDSSDEDLPDVSIGDGDEQDGVEMREDHAPARDPLKSAVKEEMEETFIGLTPAPEANDGVSPDLAQHMVVDVGDEESKPKLVVQLKYQGFNITGRCLCVVIEPWPPVRSASSAPSATPNRASSLMPANMTIAPSRLEQRYKTPLFLPDEDDERNGSITPAPMQFDRPPVPSFDDPPQEEGDSDEEEEGMMQFSQVLNSTSGFARGTMEDDDEFEGAVLFADADENREL